MARHNSSNRILIYVYIYWCFTDGLQTMCIKSQQTIKIHSTLTDVAEVTASLLDPRHERLFSLTNPDTGVVEL